MDKILNVLRAFLASLFDEPCPSDPMAVMSPRELADLPVHHPRRDDR